MIKAKRGLAAAACLLLLASCADEKVQAQPVPATTVGINMGTLASWSGERDLANLVLSDGLRVGIGGWPAPSPSVLDKNGWPLSPVTQELEIPLGPMPTPNTTRIVCTWAGGARLNPGGNLKAISASDSKIVADWPTPNKGGAWLSLPAQPKTIRALDCRAQDVDPKALFSPELLKAVQPFKVLRFMDWQRINDNKAGKWADRATATSQNQSSDQGAALEIILALVNQTKSDPWLVIPWNADDDYIEHMAHMVHDTLHAGGHVYVELGNEIWNGGFQASQQAQSEGLAEGLSTDGGEAKLRRYAEKSAHALAIWTRIFADDPHRLVRVVSTQHVLSGSAETVLSFRDTARWVDALATAPYFGYDTMGQPNATSPDAVFGMIDAAMDQTMASARDNKAVAARHGKRYIAYEAGQSLATANVDLLAAVEHDPRMEDAYRRYLNAWKTQIGDTLVLYSLTSAIGQFGAWGLQEYSGQPESETPKLRAVHAFLAH